MTILVTGGCGFLGSNLSFHLHGQGHNIHIADNLSRTGSIENLRWLQENAAVGFTEADTRNADGIERLVADLKPDAIFHLAGQVAMTTSIANPRLDFEVNALGSLNVLESVRKHAPDATVVYSSTNKVYGDLEQYPIVETATRYTVPNRPQGFDESEPLNFHSPYGCSKGSADQYMLDYARLFGIKSIVFRHSTIYGGRQFATYDQGWIGWFCQKGLERAAGSTETFTVSGSGKQVRDVLHAEDAVDLYMRCLTHGASMAGKAFNIGGGFENSLSILELLSLLGDELGVELKPEHIEPRQSDQKVFVANNSKVSQHTGWAPRVTKQEGVRRMLKWLGHSVS